VSSERPRREPPRRTASSGSASSTTAGSSSATSSPATPTPAQSAEQARTPPDQVARAALSRAKEAARARGLRPGQPHRRGVFEQPTGSPGPDARDPQPVAVTAGRLAAELGWRPGLVAGGLQNRWVELVGPQVAEHAAFEAFDAGLLTVRASSTAWATNLTLLAPQLLRRFADELGEGVVVEVRVIGPQGPGFGHGRRTVRGRGPRDTWGRRLETTSRPRWTNTPF